MSVEAKLQQILSCKTAIKSAIEGMGVEVGDASFDRYASKIRQIEGGGGSDMDDPNKVYYIDHTGTVHYEYSLQDFLNLTQEPANPPFPGLTPTGWEMSLANAQAFVRKYGFGPVIGQTYTTDDGASRFYIDIKYDFQLTIGVTYSSLSSATKLKIDWGDGSEMFQSTATSATLYHTYQQTGKYCIRYIPLDGATFKPYNGSGYQTLFGYAYISTPLYFEKLIKKVEFGNGLSGYLGGLLIRDGESISIPSGCSVGIYTGTGAPHNFSTNFGTQKSLTTVYNLASRQLKSCIIPDGITNPGSFDSCRNLRRLVLPDSITTFPVLNWCFNLSSINVPSGITTFSNSTFRSCYSLKSVELPDTVTSVGTYMFATCINLERVNIPPKLTNVNQYFCQSCQSLKSIEIPSGVTTISQYAFDGCNALSAVTFSSGLTTIGQYAFNNCRSLPSIQLPSTLTSIGNYAFQQCYLLSGTINIPEGVTTIGTNAFAYSVFGVSEITIPSTVTSVGQNAFTMQINVIPDSIPDKVVHIKPLTPPTAGATVFGSLATKAGKLRLLVPTASIDLYKNATNWKTYATLFEVEPVTSLPDNAIQLDIDLTEITSDDTITNGSILAVSNNYDTTQTIVVYDENLTWIGNGTIVNTTLVVDNAIGTFGIETVTNPTSFSFTGGSVPD